jgi:hypothetical protein
MTTSDLVGYLVGTLLGALPVWVGMVWAHRRGPRR